MPHSEEAPPGPRLPGLVQTLWFTLDQPGFWRHCRRRYGSTFSNRLLGSPPVVVTSNREGIRTVFTGDPLMRRHGNDFIKHVFGEHALVVLEPPEHLMRRRIEGSFFRGNAIRRYSERVDELVESEIAGWGDGQTLAVLPRARALTISVILELVLGVREAHLHDELAELFNWFGNPRNMIVLFSFGALKKRARWNLASRPAYTRIDKLRGLLAGHIERTRNAPNLHERTDVLAMLVRARDGAGGPALTDTELEDELLLLVSAGYETTATAIAWSCDLLAHNPDVCRRIREDGLSGDDAYLKAATKEILRLRPITLPARHVLDGPTIDGWTIGPDTLVVIDTFGVHSDPRMFSEHDDLRPERFLGDQPEGHSYVPFGGGAHYCLGAGLALLELEHFIQCLVTRVDLEAEGELAGPARRGPMLVPKNDARVRIRKRAR